MTMTEEKVPEESGDPLVDLTKHIRDLNHTAESLRNGILTVDQNQTELLKVQEALRDARRAALVRTWAVAGIFLVIIAVVTGTVAAYLANNATDVNQRRQIAYQQCLDRNQQSDLILDFLSQARTWVASSNPVEQQRILQGFDTLQTAFPSVACQKPS